MVTCGLTACTPGSAPGPTLGIEYGKAFTFTFIRFTMQVGLHWRTEVIHSAGIHIASDLFASQGRRILNSSVLESIVQKTLNGQCIQLFEKLFDVRSWTDLVVEFVELVKRERLFLDLVALHRVPYRVKTK